MRKEEREAYLRGAEGGVEKRGFLRERRALAALNLREIRALCSGVSESSSIRGIGEFNSFSLFMAMKLGL